MTPLINQMVRLLERLIPDKVLDVALPRHLNDAALAFPDTALKAIVREARHLYENVYGFVATGLGLSESDLRSEKELGEIVDNAPPPPDIDLDDLYQRRIKGLHGAIVEFATKAEPDMLPEQVELLSAIRTVVRDIVLATKDVKHLHKNLQRYTASDNADMRAQYNAARHFVAKVLRATGKISQDRQASLEALSKLEAEIEGYDIVESGELDRLIREQRITPTMGTSLINDNGYVMNIGRKLSEAGMIALKDGTYDLLMSARAGDDEGTEHGSANDQKAAGLEARAQSAT